jgi:hypothetical protein
MPGKPSSATLRSLLAVGRNALDVGRTADAVALIRAQPGKAAQLVESLWDEDPGVASRAASALEVVSRDRLDILSQWKGPLLGLLAETGTIKLRWNLALIAPRLKLTAAERRGVADTLYSFLTDRSSIVKTCALQGLADLARQDASLLPETLDLLRIHSRSGTPAMQARCRKLLRQLEPGGTG